MLQVEYRGHLVRHIYHSKSWELSCCEERITQSTSNTRLPLQKVCVVWIVHPKLKLFSIFTLLLIKSDRLSFFAMYQMFLSHSQDVWESTSLRRNGQSVGDSHSSAYWPIKAETFFHIHTFANKIRYMILFCDVPDVFVPIPLVCCSLLTSLYSSELYSIARIHSFETMKNIEMNNYLWECRKYCVFHLIP